jgi:hypothetical protein
LESPREGLLMIRALLLIAALSVLPALVRAAGTFRLNWDSCYGPITRSVVPGEVVAFYASVTGQSQPHLGFQIRIEVGRDSGVMLPDAWRFDVEGCQGSQLVSINHQFPIGVNACPSFQGAGESVQIKDYSVDPVSGRGRIVCANVYPFATNLPNPAARYVLIGVTFDHSFSMAGASVPVERCGGVEESVCFLVRQAEWLTTDLVETPWALEQEFVSANDPSFVSCLGGQVPARGSTWGALKAQYRR